MKNSFLLIAFGLLVLLAMIDIKHIHQLKRFIRNLFESSSSVEEKVQEKIENLEIFPGRNYSMKMDMNGVFKSAKSLIAPVSSFKFDENRKTWQKYENKYIKNTVENLKSFKLITYNIWFDKHNYLNRRTALLEILKKKDADVVCLQEVIGPIFEFLKGQDFIKENYYISSTMLESYNIIILSKFPLKFYHLAFPTNQNRYVVIGEIKVKSLKSSKSIVFATSHYESLDNADFREDQLKRTFNVINLFKNSFLTGDFNIDDKINETELKNFDEHYFDSWKMWMEKNTDLNRDDGYTYYEDKSEPPQRLDRILYGEYSDFELLDFEILGKEKITVDSNFNSSTVETASDHQGLFAEFKLKIQ